MSKYEKLKARMKNMTEKGQEMLGDVLQSAEIGATAFGFGFARGKMGDQNGDLDVFGVPASAGAAIVGHLLAFSGVFGKHSEHAHNIADGALAEYTAVVGMRLGAARSDFASQKRIAGRRNVAGLGGRQDPFAQGRSNFDFARNRVQNPFVRA